MRGLKAKLEAISTQRCAFAQPHWHSQESPSLALPRTDQILPRGCKGSPSPHQGHILVASGLGMDGASLSSSRFPARSRGGTQATTFGEVLYPQ